MFGFDPKCSNASQSVQSNLGYLYFKDILEYFRCICFGHLWVSQCFAKLRIQPTTMTEPKRILPSGDVSPIRLRCTKVSAHDFQQQLCCSL